MTSGCGGFGRFSECPTCYGCDMRQACERSKSARADLIEALGRFRDSAVCLTSRLEIIAADMRDERARSREVHRLQDKDAGVTVPEGDVRDVLHGVMQRVPGDI